MNRILLFPTLIWLMTACVNPPHQQDTPSDDRPAAAVKVLPQGMQQVLTAHGGLDRWQSMRSLRFRLVKETGDELHQIDLWDRRDRVEGPDFAMGYDGTDVWLQADTSYKGNAVFYHNLIFYFYAMPFVLADEGIVYSEVAPLPFEGRDYPGTKISYQAGVGTSDQDEYLLYYDPDSYQMAWLGYTATYFSGEKSADFSYIRYDDWAEFQGLKLPRSMSWYSKKDGQLTQPRRKRVFEGIELSEAALPNETFAMPEGAVRIE